MIHNYNIIINMRYWCKKRNKLWALVRMMMVLYYNNFFTIYNDIIKFYKFYVHNRMANAIPCNYFIPAIERYCTISNLRLQLSLLILHGIVGTGIMSGEAYGRKTRFLILFFFSFSRDTRWSVRQHNYWYKYNILQEKKST